VFVGFLRQARRHHPDEIGFDLEINVVGVEVVFRVSAPWRFDAAIEVAPRACVGVPEIVFGILESLAELLARGVQPQLVQNSGESHFDVQIVLVYRIVDALRRPLQFAFDDLAVGFEFRRRAKRNAYHLSRPAAFDLVFQRRLGKTARFVLRYDQRGDKQQCPQDQKGNQRLFHGNLTIEGKNYPRACSTSERVGNEACAPIRLIAMEAGTLATKIAASNVMPSASPAANAPLKQSPAAVVSFALTERAGKCRARSPSSRNAPCAPSFRITCCGPSASNSR